MPLHPQLAAMVAKASRYPPMHQVPVPLLRESAAKQLRTGLAKEDVAKVEDAAIDGPGGPIRIRIYRPTLESDLPLTMFFHGSGFVICSLDTHDDMCRQICNRSGTIVVSVDYRLAPENPYPAAPDDCRAATLWTARNGARLGADVRRLAVCGDSAGGAMAAIVSLRTRDEGGPPIKAQVLVYPVTDHYSARHPSYEARGEGYGLRRDEMQWFWDLYLPEAMDAGHAYVSPARAPDLTGMPPSYIVTAEYDVLRDEGERYAAALRAAGVPVELKRYHDMNHGFLNWVGLVDRATEAMDDLGAWMRANV
jgi:acetyl esterase